MVGAVPPSGFLLVEVRRSGTGTYGEDIDIDCSDMAGGVIQVDLRVTNELGQSSTCTSDVMIDDIFDYFTTSSNITPATSATSGDGAIAITITNLTGGVVAGSDYSFSWSTGAMQGSGVTSSISGLNPGTYHS